LSSCDNETISETGPILQNQLPCDEIPLAQEPKKSGGRFEFILAELRSEVKRVRDQLDRPVKEVIDELLSATYDVPNWSGTAKLNEKVAKLERKVKAQQTVIKNIRSREKKAGRIAPTDLKWFGLADNWGNFTDFEIFVDYCGMKSYVEQDGPNCAVASVAGALNMLSGESLDVWKIVLEFYRSKRKGHPTLQRKERPSTSCVGNGLLLRGLRAAASHCNIPIRVELLFSRKLKCTPTVFTISGKDSKETIRNQ